MRRMKTLLTLNQWLGLGPALPGPHKSFIRLHGSFLWLCWGIRNRLRCSREMSQSLPRLFLSLSEVSWACNTAFGYKPKGADTQPHTVMHTNTPQEDQKKKQKKKHTSYAHNSEHSQRQRLTHTNTHAYTPTHSPLALSSSLYLQSSGSGTRARGYNTRHLMLKLPGNLMSDIPL